ncbi:MAG: hypothetical protein FD150_1379 [Rhodobacteraceae bacterium]|nr:MAG: hypothetical protein FD150_1379 [Paracoccaceae bacterium]
MVVFVFGGLLALLVAVAAYVRLAPSDPGRWNVATGAVGASGEVVAGEVVAGEVVAGEGWARLWLPSGTARGLLAGLDAVALATPRTTRLAGSVEEGRITWITRSALWGFPDYTTAEARADGLFIYARLRFGTGDMGVNAERLRVWQKELSGQE